MVRGRPWTESHPPDPGTNTNVVDHAPVISPSSCLCNLVNHSFPVSNHDASWAISECSPFGRALSVKATAGYYCRLIPKQINSPQHHKCRLSSWLPRCNIITRLEHVVSPPPATPQLLSWLLIKSPGLSLWEILQMYQANSGAQVFLVRRGLTSVSATDVTRELTMEPKQTHGFSFSIAAALIMKA